MQAREALISEHQKEPSVDEIAKALGIETADVVMAMDAISDPVSLSEPVYGEAGEAMSVMDKICDNKNTDASWLERIALTEANGRSASSPCAFLTAAHRWRSPPRSAYRRRRCPGSRKTPSARSKRRCSRHKDARSRYKNAAPEKPGRHVFDDILDDAFDAIVLSRLTRRRSLPFCRQRRGWRTGQRASGGRR